MTLQQSSVVSHHLLEKVRFLHKQQCSYNYYMYMYVLFMHVHIELLNKTVYYI